MNRPVNRPAAGRTASIGRLSRGAVLRGLAVAVLVCCMAGMARAGEDRTEAELRLAVTLVDGSRVIGSPNIESVTVDSRPPVSWSDPRAVSPPSIKFIPVETPYAKIKVPLEQIRCVKLDNRHRRASLDLANGDRITGSVSLGFITLTTLFDKVTIPIDVIQKIDVVSYNDPAVRFKIDLSDNIHDKLKDMRFERPVADRGPYHERGPGWKTISVDVRGEIVTDNEQHDYVVAADYVGGADCYHIKNFYLVIDGVRYKDMRSEPPAAGYCYIQGAEKHPNRHRTTGFITSVPPLGSCKSAELVFELSDDLYPGGQGNELDGTRVAIGFSETVRSDGSGSPVAPDVRRRMVPGGGCGWR